MNQTTPPKEVDTPISWRKIVVKYQRPSLKKSMWQIINTGIPYIGLWALMYFTMTVSWVLTIALALLAGLFLVRVFIIFHDCGHGSYFHSKKANNIVGFISGLLTLTPYRYWSFQHAAHHGSSGNLDQRGVGDVWTMTVKEYLSASRSKRFLYRLMRNPFVLFGIVPLGLFIFYQRFAHASAKKRFKRSVWLMNAAILVYVISMSLLFGFWNYLFIQLTVTAVGSTLGMWMFYVQHQFEDTYWRKGEEWDYTNSAMKGSSFYKLPKILQWFSGNIGYHHIHHLSSRIPNYSLEKCHNEEPLFQQVPELTLCSSLKSLKLRLWDEERQKLIGYKDIIQKTQKI